MGHETKSRPETLTRSEKWPKKQKASATFCEQKVAKKLYYAGSWALSLTQSQAQHNKVFAPLFSKSGFFLPLKPPAPRVRR
jgi:hypothetical protein